MWQAVKFTLFSISAGAIQIGSFAVLEIFIQDYWIPYLTSLTLSILWNFTLNRKFTFQSASNVPIAMLKVAGFYLVFTPLSTWGGQALADIGWNEYIILALSMACNLVTEFFFQKYVVFRDALDAPPTPVNHRT